LRSTFSSYELIPPVAGSPPNLPMPSLPSSPPTSELLADSRNATNAANPTRLSFVDDSSTFNVSAATFDETIHANQLLIFICAGDHTKSP